MFKSIYRFFDKLEDKVRGFFSHYPIIYAIIGGTAQMFFWYGVWETSIVYEVNGIWAMIIGLIVLLVTGLLVSTFIGDQIILSGLKHEKKTAEKTEEEVKEEENVLENIHTHITNLESQIKELKDLIIKK